MILGILNIKDIREFQLSMISRNRRGLVEVWDIRDEGNCKRFKLSNISGIKNIEILI